MASRRLDWALVLGAMVLGGGLVGLRALLAPDVRPAGEQVWQLTLDVTVAAPTPGHKVRLGLPRDTASLRVYSETIQHPGLNRQRARRKAPRGAEIALTTEAAGAASIRATFLIHQRPDARWPVVNATPTREERAESLAPTAALPLAAAEVIATLDYLRVGGPRPAELLARIQVLCHQLGQLPAGDSPPDVARTLRTRAGAPLERQLAMVALCRSARIPARLVSGFALEEASTTPRRVWLEVCPATTWQPYDPVDGHAGKVPASWLPMRVGSPYPVDGALETVARIEPQALPVELGGRRRDPREILDLTRLSLATQRSMLLLLLLPFGALLTIAARQLLGVRTYGTFTATLLATALIHADLVSAAAVMGLVLLLGLAGRGLLPASLGRVARLSVVFTFVATTMSFVVSTLEFGGLANAGRVVLLPIVVMTSLVDRMHSVWDESGLRVAGGRLLWTLAVSLGIAAVLDWEGLGEILLRRPELHLFTVAVVLLLGMYEGPGLFEWLRLSWLLEPVKTKPSPVSTDPAPEPPAAAPATPPEAAPPQAPPPPT